MESALFSGLFDLSWRGLVAVVLALTHITIASVTIFLHRHQAHHALDLHPAPTPYFAAPKPAVDPDTLQAVIRCRYDVLAKYAQSLKRTYAEELGKLRRLSPQEASGIGPLVEFSQRLRSYA